jgi:transposase
MKKRDGRSLPHEVLEQFRKDAIQRIRDGEKPSAVIASYGFSRTSIYKWIRKAKRGGIAALASTKAPGPRPKLSSAQEAQVVRWMNGKDPRQYGFDFGLWTRHLVRQLIWDRFQIEMNVVSVGRLLARLGITPQKPLRRAYERDPAAIEKWVREEFPSIRARAKRCGAKIFFLDEAGIRSDSALGRTWAPRGKTPVVATSGQRQAINAISAVNSKGAFWFETFTEKLNAPTFLRFLKRFRKGRGRIVLILDRHPAHRAKLIARYVQSLRGKLEIHFLPGYAPDLNPDEFVWSHLRQKGVVKVPLMKGELLRRRVNADLAKLKRSPATIRALFRAPSVVYAAH